MKYYIFAKKADEWVERYVCRSIEEAEKILSTICSIDKDAKDYFKVVSDKKFNELI